MKAGDIMYKLSKNGIDDLIVSEGIRLKVYKDVKGLETIGIGHLLTAEEITTRKITIKNYGKVLLDGGMTKGQVVELFKQDASRFIDSVNKLSSHINQGQFDALVSFAFNIGVSAFERSTAFRYVSEDRHDEVPRAIMMWVIPESLTRRRMRESGSYFANIEQDFDSPIPEFTKEEYQAILTLLA